MSSNMVSSSSTNMQPSNNDRQSKAEPSSTEFVLTLPTYPALAAIVGVKSLPNGDISITIKLPSNAKPNLNNEPPPYSSPVPKKKKKSLKMTQPTPITPVRKHKPLYGDCEYYKYLWDLDYWFFCAISIMAEWGLLPFYCDVWMTLAPLCIMVLIIGDTFHHRALDMEAWQVILTYTTYCVFIAVAATMWLQRLNKQMCYAVNSGGIIKLKLRSMGIAVGFSILALLVITFLMILAPELIPYFGWLESLISQIPEPNKEYRFFMGW